MEPTDRNRRAFDEMHRGRRGSGAGLPPIVKATLGDLSGKRCAVFCTYALDPGIRGVGSRSLPHVSIEQSQYRSVIHGITPAP